MRYTSQIKKAIQFAARKHEGQFRKESEPLPYITHLFSVALLVAEGNSDEDVVAAALLHDTIEDTDTSAEELEQHFNERVALLVASVTEPHEQNGEKLSWKKKKVLYIQQLETAPLEAVQISAADKIDNIESKLEAFLDEGPGLLARWKQPIEEYVWYHGEVLRIAQTRLPEHSLTVRLVDAFFREKQILAGV
jgi:(p)ppGpp synthase/HD superfamily hydrolase